MTAIVMDVIGTELREGEGTLKYQVHGTDLEGVAKALVNAAAPIVWEGLFKQDVIVSELGGGVWEGEVPYGKAEQLGVDWSFEIATATIHITHALEHIADFPTGAPNHLGSIGVKGDDIEGTDVAVSVFTWQETHFYPAALVGSHAFLTSLESLTATCNLAPWRTWGKGELLLLGASASKQAEKPIPVTFKFASSRTVVNEKIPDNPGGIVCTKEGHHYLWVEYEEDADGVNKSYRPMAVHVERVYDYGDWAAKLPLPDPWT